MFYSLTAQNYINQALLTKVSFNSNFSLIIAIIIQWSPNSNLKTEWEAVKNLHTDMFSTEYRNRFNQDKPLHKNALRVNVGRLPKYRLIFIFSYY